MHPSCFTLNVCMHIRAPPKPSQEPRCLQNSLVDDMLASLWLPVHMQASSPLNHLQHAGFERRASK